MQQFFPFPTNQLPNNCDFDLLNLEALIMNEAQLQFLSIDLDDRQIFVAVGAMAMVSF